MGRPSIISEINGETFKKITYVAPRLKDQIVLDVGQNGTIIYDGEVMDQRLNKWTGYMYCVLPKGVKFSGLLPVHRLVAIAWWGKPRGRKTFVDHINSCRTDNSYKNLRWSTRKQNASKRLRNSRNGLFSNAHSKHIIRATSKDGTQSLAFMNATDAAKWIGCSRVMIYRVLNEYDWPKTAKGWTLSWVEIKSGMTVRFSIPE